MPDIAALKIINVNIDSIQATGMWKEECNTNIGYAKEANTRQEAHVMNEGCTNMDGDSKVDNNTNGYNNNTNVNTLTNYFLSLPNVKEDKRKGIELT